MYLLLPLLMIAAVPDAPSEARDPQSVEVFHCTFEPRWDKNFDEWPDGWTRRRGPGFPHYVSIKIHEPAARPGNRCLRIDLDGGAAAAYSPPVSIDPRSSYVLQGHVKTEGLEHDRAYLSLTLLDENRQRLETFDSAKVQQTEGWKRLRLGPVVPRSDRARFAVIGLHVQPQSGQDLEGTVLFDEIRLGRLPRMDLATNHPYNFFTAGEAVEVVCTASGPLDESPTVLFRLEDVLGRELARHRGRLAVAAVDVDQSAGKTGRTSWQPLVTGPGFYRVHAGMKGRTATVFHRQLSFVVIEPHRRPPGSEFGWTVPTRNHPMPLPALRKLVTQGGVGWLKYPLWYDDSQSAEFVKELIALSERLDAHEIELVGLLSDPPAALREQFGQSAAPEAAQLFAADPSVWYPSLESVMVRMATRVRWWQLGDDTDTSFVEYPDLVERIHRVKTELDRVGQGVNVGLGWKWGNALPSSTGGPAPWRYLSLSSDPPLTHEELAAHLDASAGGGPQRWVVVEPLPAADYTLEVRVEDLVRRMIAAKIHGAEAIFCPRLFSTARGLMHDDGTPGELLLPWRTTALTLGGAAYLGSIQLPQGSPNHVFARDGEAVMVVFSGRATEEALYLGEQVRQIDLWGRNVAPSQQGRRQVLRVGRLPTFVTGLSLPVARWRMDLAFEHQRLPSVFGRPHSSSLRFTNHFPGGAGGELTLAMPGVWRVEPRKMAFRLAEGERTEQHFELTFPYEATSGRHPLSVDFEVQADRVYRFSVYRHLDVGLGDVYVEVATRLNDRGELEVQQRLVNRSGRPVSFRCQLFIPQRRRLRTQVIDLPPGHDVKTYRLDDGEQLLGTPLWLQAQELDGPRILNYRFVAAR